MSMHRSIVKSATALALSFTLLLTGACYAKQSDPAATSPLGPTAKQTQLDRAISELLAHVHYRHSRIDDALSSTILDEYLATLDFNKSFFLASDIREFERYRTALDDGLRSGDLTPVYRIFQAYQRRLEERTARIREQLRQPVDFSVDESVELDRKDAPWARDAQELDEVWRKRLKHELLTLTLAGKDLEAARQLLDKRYENRLRQGRQLTADEVFEGYMNAVAQSFDPHTAYMSPSSSDDFDIRMRLSLQGIGAVLSMEDESVEIMELVPGSPAALSKQIKPKDRIIGVAQGEDGPMVDVIGWRLKDVVALIRGERGSVVRLEVMPANAEAGAAGKTVRLVRDQIQLEEQAAKSSIKTLPGAERSYRVGVITIPGFYVDFAAAQRGDADYRSTTRDVQRLLEQLKQDKVDGIVIDLRRNGGGSLKEVVKLTGLFIKEGPVVQVRSAQGEIDQEVDTDPSVVYDGPLAVLVDRFSASASEIFAGAIQDYGRGVVIGDRTFGKGTVQTLIDLDRVFSGKEGAAGQLKLTVAKFYRVNGSSTQHRGVVPDIRFPSAFEGDDVGESAEKHALPWDEIAATRYRTAGWIAPDLVHELDRRHQTRIAADPEFRDYLEDVAKAQEAQRQKTVSLNQAKRKAEQDQLRAKQRERENRRRAAQGLKPLAENEEIPEPGKDGPDPLLDETAHIMADMIGMLERTDSVALKKAR